jgi:hypothetical protein
VTVRLGRERLRLGLDTHHSCPAAVQWVHGKHVGVVPVLVRRAPSAPPCPALLVGWDVTPVST